MKTLRSIENKINPENPFEDCKLEREKYADNLTRIIENYPSGFVMALNNRWGDGKTFFVNRWRTKLKEKEKFQVVYYNAWEDDYSENALVSIISEITEDIENPDKKLLDNVLEKGTGIFVKSLPVLFKIAAKKLVGNEGFGDLASLVGEEIGKPFQNLVDEYKKQKETVKDFKIALQEFAESSGNGKPVVFFIDELDRCKPSYAVEVLEIVKHLFSVDNIVFVLSVDKEQLANSIRGYYGSDNIDGIEYLRRFIDFEFTLPTISNQKLLPHFFGQFDLYSFFEERKNKKSNGYSLNDDFEFLMPYCEFLIEFHNLSARQVEKFVSTLKVMVLGVPHYSPLLSTLTGFLIFIKLFRPTDFKKLEKKEFSFEEIFKLNQEVSLSRITELGEDNLRIHAYQEFCIFNTYIRYKNKNVHSQYIIDEFEKVKSSAMFPKDVLEFLNMTSIQLPEKKIDITYLLDYLNFNKSI